MTVRGLLHALCAIAVLAACGGSAPDRQVEETEASNSEAWGGDVAAAARLLRPREGTEEDWQIFRDKATWAWELGLDTLPMGESVVFIGLSFLGTRYIPGTLELAGDEDVVVNLQEMDCVTFVENSLGLAQFIRLADPSILDSGIQTQDMYRRILASIRYRGGSVEGYPSRLHYFTDWILDNESRGQVREITRELGGEEDPRAIDFMSSHPEAYRQLANPMSLNAIRDREFYLNEQTRHLIPEGEVPAWSSWIQDGDIIAATSTVDGLDIAHTGLAIWQDGALHLLHSPLVGGVVEVSSLPLADRILRIESQDGIRVVRPMVPEGASGTE